jgi:hypothetical protein
MPSGNDAQTRKTNAIYYAVDDPHRHKSHDSGVDAAVGQVDPPGFFLMQGPLGINWRSPGHPRIENASLATHNWGRPDRVRAWLDCQVHVKGRPEWLFVKLHAHGAVEKDFDALFGELGFRMHETLNEMCNDGVNYKLHYVTARQAYNLAKAAERGLSGDPLQYRDLVLGKPVTEHYALDAEHDLHTCTAERLRIDNVADGRDASLKTRLGALRTLRGPWRGADASVAGDGGGTVVVDARSTDSLTLAFDRAVRLQAGDAAAQPTDADGVSWRVVPRQAGPLELRFHAAAPA